MSDQSMLFSKPIGILAKSFMGKEYAPEPEIRIKFTQNGLKLRVGDKSFIASSIEEILKIAKTQMDKMNKDLKNDDKEESKDESKKESKDDAKE